MGKAKIKKSELLMGFAFLAPALIVIFCFTIIPIFSAIYTSFHATTYAQVGEFVGLKNYIEVLGKSTGWKNILNSIEYVLMSLVIAIPLGVGIGSLLNRKIKGIAVLRTLIIIPWILSQTVTALLWKWLLNGNYGLVTYWVYALTGKKIDLFSNVITAKLLVVVANVWNSLPIIIILTLAALQTISPELVEAAKVDGASRKTVYTKITLPLIRPTLGTAVVMQSIEYFNMVTLIYVLTSGGPFNQTQTLSLAAYQNGFDYWHMDIAAAYSIIIFLLNIVFSLFYVRILRGNDN
ncbi:MAG: sugar ABC transporter permease [Lachnospiraceae bacterium]|nr:sugar ABC transporter permease [Lachnospiraceae bacterium]